MLPGIRTWSHHDRNVFTLCFIAVDYSAENFPLDHRFKQLLTNLEGLERPPSLSLSTLHF